MEDVKLSDIRIYYRQIDSASVQIQKDVPEYIKDYPEPQRFGVMPAYGFFIRHARNIELNNVEVSFLGKETRPAVVAEDVDRLRFNNFRAQKAAGKPLLIRRGVNRLEIFPGQSIPLDQISTERIRPTVPDKKPGKNSNNH